MPASEHLLASAAAGHCLAQLTRAAGFDRVDSGNRAGCACGACWTHGANRALNAGGAWVASRSCRTHGSSSAGRSGRAHRTCSASGTRRSGRACRAGGTNGAGCPHWASSASGTSGARRARGTDGARRTCGTYSAGGTCWPDRTGCANRADSTLGAFRAGWARIACANPSGTAQQTARGGVHAQLLSAGGRRAGQRRGIGLASALHPEQILVGLALDDKARACCRFEAGISGPGGACSQGHDAAGQPTAVEEGGDEVHGWVLRKERMRVERKAPQDRIESSRARLAVQPRPDTGTGTAAVLGGGPT